MVEIAVLEKLPALLSGTPTPAGVLRSIVLREVPIELGAAQSEAIFSSGSA